MIQAAFKRAGTYELKASLVKPEKGDVENVTKKLTQGANKSIKITSPAADGDNWVVALQPQAIPMQNLLLQIMVKI